jgi:hypothetical protein
MSRLAYWQIGLPSRSTAFLLGIVAENSGRLNAKNK